MNREQAIQEVLNIIEDKGANDVIFNVVEETEDYKEVRMFIHFGNITELVATVLDMVVTENNAIKMYGVQPELNLIEKFNYTVSLLTKEQKGNNYPLSTNFVSLLLTDFF